MNYKASIGTEDDGEFCESDENVNKRANIQDVEACKVRYCHLSHNVAMSNTYRNRQGELFYPIVHFCNLSKKNTFIHLISSWIWSPLCAGWMRSWTKMQILEFWQNVQFLFLTCKTFTRSIFCRKSFAFDNWMMDLFVQFLLDLSNDDQNCELQISGAIKPIHGVVSVEFGKTALIFARFNIKTDHRNSVEISNSINPSVALSVSNLPIQQRRRLRSVSSIRLNMNRPTWWNTSMYCAGISNRSSLKSMLD